MNELICKVPSPLASCLPLLWVNAPSFCFDTKAFKHPLSWKQSNVKKAHLRVSAPSFWMPGAWPFFFMERCLFLSLLSLCWRLTSSNLVRSPAVTSTQTTGALSQLLRVRQDFSRSLITTTWCMHVSGKSWKVFKKVLVVQHGPFAADYDRIILSLLFNRRWFVWRIKNE